LKTRDNRCRSMHCRSKPSGFDDIRSRDALLLPPRTFRLKVRDRFPKSPASTTRHLYCNLVLTYAVMDKFVTVTKPAGRAPSNESKGGAGKKQFKYNPYPIPKGKERQVEAWRDKKRTEK
jgi:hypothetical protein